MSKNANYIYPPFVMSNDINKREGQNKSNLLIFLSLNEEMRTDRTYPIDKVPPPIFVPFGNIG